MRALFLISIIILFNGCSQRILHPELKKEISDLLSIKTITQECHYPTLPIYKTPSKTKVPKGMSLEDAFKECVKTNKQLRFINRKYRRVAVETNKRYQ